MVRLVGRGKVQKTPKNSLFWGMKCLEFSLKIMCVHDVKYNLRRERDLHNEVCVSNPHPKPFQRRINHRNRICSLAPGAGKSSISQKFLTQSNPSVATFPEFRRFGTKPPSKPAPPSAALSEGVRLKVQLICFPTVCLEYPYDPWFSPHGVAKIIFGLKFYP